MSARTRAAPILAILTLAALGASSSHAAQLVDRNATNVKLAVNDAGVALLSYKVSGETKHVLARGAINALLPSTTTPQVKFQLDYSGGRGFFGREVWQQFRDGCRRYDGPALYALVVACKAPDGSYWALQSWQQALPDLGFTPWLPEQKDQWLLLSHWSGSLPVLHVDQAWNWGSHYNQIFGTFTYAGSPVHGFGTTSVGVPTDSYGRLLYLDTLNSTYGTGWRRENSFVSRKPSGHFCYGFLPRDPTKGGYVYPPGWSAGNLRGPALGSSYRFVASGPGVTPVISWTGAGLHKFDESNPADSIHLIRTSRDTSDVGRKACMGGTFARLAGAVYENSIIYPNASSLAALHDDFAKWSATRWRGPVGTGGATLNFGSSGLVFSHPAGQPSSVQLSTRRSWLTQGGGAAFIDLGSTGVQDGSSFLIDFETPQGGGYSYVGVRIGSGQLQWVHNNSAQFNSRGERRPRTQGEIKLASVPYDASAMRWIFLRRGAQPEIKGKRFEAYYAPNAAGPWTLFATTRVPGWWGLSRPARLRLETQSDGTTAARIVVAGLNE